MIKILYYVTIDLSILMVVGFFPTLSVRYFLKDKDFMYYHLQTFSRCV